MEHTRVIAREVIPERVAQEPDAGLQVGTEPDAVDEMVIAELTRPVANDQWMAERADTGSMGI